MLKFTKSIVKACNAAAFFFSLLKCIEVCSETKEKVHSAVKERLNAIDELKRKEKYFLQWLKHKIVPSQSSSVKKLHEWQEEMEHHLWTLKQQSQCLQKKHLEKQLLKPSSSNLLNQIYLPIQAYSLKKLKIKSNSEWHYNLDDEITNLFKDLKLLHSQKFK